MTPSGWTRVCWPAEAIELLTPGRVTGVSLDHDLGDDERGTGYNVVLWIAEQVALRVCAAADERSPGNVPARVKMENRIRAIEAVTRSGDE